MAKDSHFTWSTPDQEPEDGHGVLVLAIFHHTTERPQSTAWPQALIPTAGQPWRIKGCGRPLCSCGARCEEGQAECPLCLAQTTTTRKRGKKEQVAATPALSIPLFDDTQTSSRRTIPLDDLLAEAAAGNDESDEPEDSEQREEEETAEEEEETAEEDEEEEQEADEDESDESMDSAERSDPSNVEPTGETSDSPGREADPRDKFSHGSTKPANGTSMCPICGFRANNRFAQAIVTHMRNRHTAEEMRRIANNALKKNGLVRCNDCEAIIPAPNAARTAHKCGNLPKRRTELNVLRRQETATGLVTVYTDGSCKDNRAAAAAFFGTGDGRSCTNLVEPATNQRAELTAVVMAARAAPIDSRIHVLSDSQWVVDGYLRKNSVSTHLDLWEELFSFDARLTVEKIQGHAGVNGNTMADLMAGSVTGECTVDRLARFALEQYGATTSNIVVTATATPAIFAPKQRQGWTWRGQGQMPDLAGDMNDPWFATVPQCKRFIHRTQWRSWIGKIEPILRGYGASSIPERARRQLEFLNLPRTHLARQARDEQKQQPREQHDRQEDVEVKIRRARRFTMSGAIGKAARALIDTGYKVASATPVVIARVQALHPPEPGPLPNPPEIGIIGGVAPHLVQRAVMQMLARAASPGPDGWTRELLVPVAQHAELNKELTVMVEDILSGAVSATFAHRITAVAVLPLEKGTKMRPITPESCLAKLASAVGELLLSERVRSKFPPLQDGVGGDVEATATSIKRLIRLKGKAVLYDGVNAYNSVFRSQVLESSFTDPDLKPIHGLIQLLLGSPGFVGVYDACGNLVARIAATRGIRQGMRLGPLLFAQATLHALRLVADRHPEVTVKGYLDDITLVSASAPALKAAATDLVAEMAKIGILPNFGPDKTKYVVTSEDDAAPITVHGHALHRVPMNKPVRILGSGFVPDGSAAPLKTWLKEQVASHATFFDRLQHPKLKKQPATALLIGAGLPRMNFLVRTHTAEEVIEAATSFDDMVFGTLEAIVGSKVQGTSREIAKLPIRMSGLGLQSQRDLTAYAHDCVGRKGAQREATAKAAEDRLSSILQSLSGNNRHLLAAGAASSAGRTLLSGVMSLSDRAFQLFLKQRLLIEVLGHGIKCVCGCPATNHHVNTCTRLRSNPRQQRHDAVLLALSNSLETLGIRTIVEPHSSVVNRARPDLLTSGSVTDVTIRYPAAENGQAMTMAIKEKTRQWKNWSAERDLDFAPFALNSCGGVAQESRAWLRRCIRSADTPVTAQENVEYVLLAVVRATLQQAVPLFAAASTG